MKIFIQAYKNKIKNLEKELESKLDNSKLNNNIIDENNEADEHLNSRNKEEMINSKESELINDKNSKINDFIHDEDGITIPMLLFCFSISLFIGKFIKSSLFN